MGPDAVEREEQAEVKAEAKRVARRDDERRRRAERAARKADADVACAKAREEADAAMAGNKA